jgi:hypothetical protein
MRLLPRSDRAKDFEILALRHQITVLQGQLGEQKPRIVPSDRALLAALLHPLPRNALRGLRLLVHPNTVLRWHRNLIAPALYWHPTRRRIDPHGGLSGQTLQTLKQKTTTQA